MAGLPWFEADVDFPDHPKTLDLCVRLKDQNAGMYLVRLWAYCYRHACDRFPAESEETIEGIASWRGKKGRLVEALMASGSLERDGDHLVVHGVAERLAPHLAKRAADTERQRRRRDKAAESIGYPENVTRDVPRDIPRDDTRDVRRESRRDKDKDKDLTVSDHRIVPHLDENRDETGPLFEKHDPADEAWALLAPRMRPGGPTGALLEQVRPVFRDGDLVLLHSDPVAVKTLRGNWTEWLAENAAALLHRPGAVRFEVAPNSGDS